MGHVRPRQPRAEIGLPELPRFEVAPKSAKYYLEALDKYALTGHPYQSTGRLRGS